MPRQVTEIDVLRDYLNGVLIRADDHAHNVNEVALSVAGGVVWKKDDEPLKVYTREGKMTNVLWFKVDGKQYALSYNHRSGKIELRHDGMRGSIVGSFSNKTTNAQVRTIFDSL